MQKAIIQFVITALLGLGIGYLAFDIIGGKSSDDQDVATTESNTPDKQATESKDENTNKEESTETVAADGGILSSKGCLGCHSVDALNLKGGATGPDLSQAFNNVEGKHGKPINEFLKQPTSAVMSSVIGGSPLSDEEITQVVDLLKEASSK
ncbi:cytochrome C [Bacillus sp. CGMCC 1.16607]|uniref:cytochrome C n=1 Tax=Bacillus sp. CGMCC 1.16607 TaxID=3351842 RepID=UPI003626EC8B